MTSLDQMKQKAKSEWSNFASMENFTETAAPRPVKFADTNANNIVLELACGAGVVALAAARWGASVAGADLTPALIKRGRENSKKIDLNMDFYSCEVGDLPFEDASFGIVVRQFGHMFARKSSVALSEMLWPKHWHF